MWKKKEVKMHSLMGLMLMYLIFIVLTFGFVAGYWLINSGYKHTNWLKILGLAFGWIIIVYAVILTITAINVGITAAEECKKGGCPCPLMKMMKHRPMPPMMKDHHKDRFRDKHNDPRAMERFRDRDNHDDDIDNDDDLSHGPRPETPKQPAKSR